MSEADYVVIGSGSSGAVVSARLSENPWSRVVVLEAGGSDKSPIIQMPAASYLYAIGSRKYDWCFKGEADPTRFGREDDMPRGRTLGGSSSINGMLYVRGQPRDFDDWAALGNRDWDFKSVLPYFRKSEDNENGASEFHGAGGPLKVSNLRAGHPISNAFLEAASKYGLKRTTDINQPPNDGVGFVQATQIRGRRCSAARAFLWPARSRSNLDIRTHAWVTRIIFNGKKAVGVEYEKNGRTGVVKARRGIVLSAGALASPQILMLSGVGPASHLRSHGINVVHDLPGVGQNFQDHPGTNHTAFVNRATYNVQTNLFYKAMFGAQWLLFGRGPGSTPDTHIIGFTRSRPDLSHCDLQYHFTPVGYDFGEDGPIMFDKPAVTGITNIHRPHSRGEITLRSPSYRDQPRIQSNLFGDERDIDTLVAGSKILRGIFDTEPLRQFVTGEMFPGKEVQTEDEWRDYVRRTAIGIYHPAGTCKMGRDPMAVVTDRLAVHGLEGLYVADASIMPTIVSANLNANCIMIGERMADFLRKGE
ncbi:GMC family oxidoreductase [Agrobacterium sp. NPDC089420]|uniref:GMC family oxidoreductase n=1 Tax=Agrobacterium sp. NPDC089420 TaxID=3363918 RepID=UPI00384E7EEA